MTIIRTKAERRIRSIAILSILAAIALLSACGGGGGGGGAATLPPAAGPPRPLAAGFSSGLFLGQGSVVVNGVEFGTAPGVTSFTIDDAAATESDFRIGMILKVRGTFGPTTLTGTAQSVDAEPQLIGTVGGLSGSSFSMLGQSVTFNNTTILDNVPGGTLTDGDVVEVHGLFTAANAIQATCIRGNASGKVQIRGVVDTLNAGAGTLTIGSQQADFTPPGPAGLAVESFVEVEGSLVGGVIQATTVVIEDIAAEAAGREIEVEGTVVDAPDGTTFTLRTASGPVPVSFSNATTRFELEERNTVTTSAILTPGAHVEVEGNMIGGTLVATEIELERRENVVLEGDVQGLSGNTFTLSPFNFSIDFAGALITPPGAQVTNNAHVEVGGNVAPPGTPGSIVVTRVTVLPPDTRLFLQGPVANVNIIDNTFSILGIPIDLTGLQERDDPVLGLISDYVNAANVRIDRSNFMDRLRNNVSVVKAKAEADPANPPFSAGTLNPRAGVEIEEHR